MNWCSSVLIIFKLLSLILFMAALLSIILHYSAPLLVPNSRNVTNKADIQQNSSFHYQTLEIPSYLVELIFQFETKIFMIDPNYLTKFLSAKQLNELLWRYNFKVINQSTITTFGLFDYHLDEFEILLKRLNISHEKFESHSPFIDKHVLSHVILHLVSNNNNETMVHIVVFHHVQHFLWIGKFPESPLNNTLKIQFGNYEQIFDIFMIDHIDFIPKPNEIEHFLSQLMTSKYIHCDRKKFEWFDMNSISINGERIFKTIESIITMKQLMKELRWEFWIMCGTLLGWYRHCHPIPYTTDTDFSTWPKYFNHDDYDDMLNITLKLRSLSPKFNLHLFYRFGEPKRSLEYSFRTQYFDEKIDLFVTYDGRINDSAENVFMIPSHHTKTKNYIYYIYPRYNLCSIELLGYKLLAPCESEAVIMAEYGEQWNRPIEKWNYIQSPFNAYKKVFNFNESINQYDEYRRLFNVNKIIIFTK